MVRFAVVLFSFLLFLSAAQAEKRVALVIGNSAYQHAGELTNPKNDAIDMAAALNNHSFKVIEGYDLDKASLDRKIRDFALALQGADVGLFFYAGHGLQVAGQNYIVPVDAELTTAAALDFEMVRLDLVHRTMEREARTNILFLDACRNNPLARNLARALGTRSAEIGRGLAPVESGNGTLISFSTQPGNVALDGTGRNSPFAGALVKHLAAANDDLTGILINVRNAVMTETQARQVPWEHSAMTARFFFSEPKASSDQVAELTLWNSVRTSDDPAEVQLYLKQFPQGAFAVVAANLVNALIAQTHLEQLALAERKKRELELSEIKAEVLKAQEAAKRADAMGASLSFDGVWEVHGTSQNCHLKSWNSKLTVADGELKGDGAKISGRVSKDGSFKYTRAGAVDPNVIVSYAGKLQGEAGTGRYSAGSNCSGMIVLKKLS